MYFDDGDIAAPVPLLRRSRANWGSGSQFRPNLPLIGATRNALDRRDEKLVET
jgi:hypothetical protein